MPPADRFQRTRYEIKYVVDERCAQGIREFVCCYLEPDAHALVWPGYQYPVSSLYLDSTSMDLCRATLAGLRNRFKLRIRFYDDSPDSPAWFEIKRRLDAAICKRRVPVRRSSVPALLAGHMPTGDDLAEPDPEALGALQGFCRLARQLQAQGRVMVSYRREAYASRGGGSVRITLDRGLLGGAYDGRLGFLQPGYARALNVGGVVLEVKFTDRFPLWLQDMVCLFNLQRRSVAKYVLAALELRRSGGWGVGLPVGRLERPAWTAC